MSSAVDMEMREIDTIDVTGLEIGENIKVLDNALIKMGIHQNMYGFVSRNGHEWEPTKFVPSKKYRQGLATQCFRNALDLATRNPNLMYVEGWATNHACGNILFMHAWNAEIGSTKVIDNTWLETDKNKYYGMVVPVDKIWPIVYDKGWYGVIDTPVGPNFDFMVEQDPEYFADWYKEDKLWRKR
jgi:hypothetical protein